MTRCLEAQPRWLSRRDFKEKKKKRKKRIIFWFITSWKEFPVSLINVTETSRPPHEITIPVARIRKWLIDWTLMKMRQFSYFWYCLDSKYIKKNTHVEQTQLTYWVKHSYILYSLWINILKHTFLYFQNISAHPASLHSYVCKTSYFKSGNIFFDIVRIKFVKKKKYFGGLIVDKVFLFTYLLGFF